MLVGNVMVPDPIAAAPDGDGWVLGYVPIRGELHDKSPWLAITRCDGGWRDDEGYLVEPTVFVPLPDPQPCPTGWKRAEGAIFVSNGWLGDDRKPVWLVGITLPDGSNDDSREWDIRSSKDQAITAACQLSAMLDLPWSEMPFVDAPSNIIPFNRADRA